MLAGDPDHDEEVLVDRDQADRPVVTGEAAQRGGEGLDVLHVVVGQLSDLPDAFLAVGGQGEVALRPTARHVHLQGRSTPEAAADATTPGPV